MINSGNNARRGNSTLSSSPDAPSLPQCLPLEPITLGNKKQTRSGELRRVLGVPPGSTSEAHSFGVGRSKPTPPMATKELRNFKESVQDTTKKARSRAKVLGKSISKLDEYREVLGSVVKRQRTDLLSNGRSGGGNLSMGGQILRYPHDQRLEDKTKTVGLGPKTRIRTSLLDARTDGRTAAAPRQQVFIAKDKDMRKVGDGGGGVHIEEKVRRLPVGGSGWDKKMKRKRSVGGVGNRVLNGGRDIKRATLVKPSDDTELHPLDAQGFRSRASAGISGMKLLESSMPTNLSSRTILRNELESIPPVRDRTTIIDETLVGNGNIKAARSSCVSMLDTSVDLNTSSGALGGGDQPTNRNKSPAVGVEDNQKHTISTSSSAHHMAQWVGQRPLKISRTRRANLVFPVSNSNEAQMPTQGLTTSDLSAGTPCESAVFSEGEESRGGEVKLKENESDGGEVAINAEHKGPSFVSHSWRNKVLVKREVGDGVQGHGIGSLLPSNRPAGMSTKEKTEKLPAAKPFQSSRRVPDKNRSKSGRRPSKMLTDRKVPVRAGPVLNCGSADFTGESDDHEELLAAAKYARNASNLACSSSFWKKMEYYFTSITSEDASYLKDKLNLVEELNGNLSQMLDDEYNPLSVLMHKEISNKKSDMGRMFNKSPPLYQRLLSALIEEDESEEINLQSEARNMSFQSASDDSHCGSCNHVDGEPKDRDRLESEVESEVNLQSYKHFLDRTSCNKSASSNTNGSLSNNEQWQADDGLSYSSQVDACAYQMLSLDDRLLLELQSIGLCPVIMPHLTEEEELNQDIMELQAALFQQVGKMKLHLGKIDKAIPDARDAARQNMEQVAMNQLIEMAYKRRMAFRPSQSSKSVIRRVSKQVALAFAKRTLARCQKFEDTGRSCFAEPDLQDVLLSAPPSKKSNVKSTNIVGSKTASNTHNESHNQKTELIGSASGDLSSTLERCSFNTDNKSEIQHDPMLNRGKRREMLLDDVISPRTPLGGNGNRYKITGNKPKAMPKQKANRNGPRTNFVGTTHPTGPFNRGSGPTVGNVGNILSQRQEEEEPADFENGFGSVDLGGPQDLVENADLSSLLDFEEDGLQDLDCTGLEIPMDDLSDLHMLM